MRRRTAIVLFDEVEVLDFAGPFEVFSVADELSGHQRFEVLTIAENAAPVRARNGLKITPDHSLATAPAADLLVVPGGYGTRALLKNPAVLDWVRTQAAGA
jgi:transcriptional regulator GlxA family with amidase domain